MKSKLFLVGATMLLFAACSQEPTGKQGEDNDPVQVELSKASYTIGGGDNSRVSNYAFSGYNTRSIEGFEIPAYPTDEEINANNPKELRNATSSDTYCIVTGDYDNYYVNAANQPSTLYVKGNFKGGFNGGTWTVYVLEGGSFEYVGGNIGDGITICNWGKFTTSGDFSLNSNQFVSTGDVWINGTLTCPSGAKYYCEGTTYAKRLSINSGSKIESCSFVVGDPDNYPTPDQWGNVAWDAQGVIAFDGGNFELHTCYIQAGYINMGAHNNLHLTLEENGRIDTKYLKIDPKQNNQKIVTLGSTAVVCVSEIFLNQNFQQNEEKLLPNFATGVHLQDVESIHENGNANDPELYDIPTDGGINNPDFNMTGYGCSPGYGDPEDEPEPTPSLDLVIQVESVTHDHDIDKSDPNRRHLSATSLTFDGNGNIYASYHMRGGNWANDTYDKDDIEGCIERWEFDGETVGIGNWMWTNEFDFNHIIIDQEYVITVGHKGGEKEIVGQNGQKHTDFGGIIGKLPQGIWARNWDAENELTREDFQYKYLTTEVPLMGDYENESGNVTNQKVDYQSAGDGNCVVKVGDRYFVATSAGYGVIDSDFKRIKDDKGNVLFHSTAGSSKYLVVDNGQVHVLYLNDRAVNGSLQTTSFGATLASMSVDAFPAEGTTTSMQNNVSPVDGKNVIAVDNGVVYACLSKGGLQAGDEIITFGEERSVNGVAVDDAYIYVANGSYISILDKNTKQVVVERKGNTKNVSANFVEVKEYNGAKYVFVAFGQEGIKVFKFVEA